MSLEPELRGFFADYVRRFNAALDGRADLNEIAAQYTLPFMAAGPDGVSAADSHAEFLEALKHGFEVYRALGTQSMAIRDLDVTSIDDTHSMATVFFRASYVRPSDSAPIEIDFDVTYLLERREQWRVFVFIAGDEQALYEEHGLVPPQP